MPRLKLTLEYDGTDYVGWQVQPNGVSIQSRLEAALLALTGEKVRLEVAGRTDSGVHAEGQVVCFDTTRQFPMKAYVKGLSGHLPPDIAVVRAEEVPADFNPRHDSKGKRYRYQISNAPHLSPLKRRTHWQIFTPLDVEAMKAAAPFLLGAHDYSAFRAADCEAKSATRELWKMQVEGKPGADITVTVEGTAFLKHMVRNIVGTLVDVGRGKHPPEWVRDVLASKDRSLSGPTAPPQGLTMVEVFYGKRPQSA